MPEPAASPVSTAEGFAANWPSCPFCGGSARPAVMMMEDVDWQDVKSQSKRKDRWVIAVLNMIGLQTKPLKVCILEMGAGGNVTTIRGSSERISKSYIEAGADVKLIRVNADLPFGDEAEFAPG